MTIIDKFKAEQHDQEVDLLTSLAQAKLEALQVELDVIRRNVRLTDDESARIIMASFLMFATQIGVDEGNTREEFLETVGAMFDDIIEDMGPDDEVTDKGSTDGGGAADAVS